MFNFLRNLFYGRGRLKKPRRDYFITTAASSQDRVRRLGLPTPPPGGSIILDIRRLSLPNIAMEPAPDSFFEWLIDVEPGEGRFFLRDQVLRIFDQHWRRSFRMHTLYGLNMIDNKWTYVVAEEDWDRFMRVQVGVNLLQLSPDTGASDLRACYLATQERMRMQWRWGTVFVTESPEAAVLRSAELVALKDSLHQDVVIRLTSDDVYPGVQAWEVLTATGLQWGDGDLFHWMWDSQELFSVWTNTDPGYFFPEAIKAGTHNPKDLVFGFWIGRSLDPVGVFDIMVEAARHCQKMLGGELMGLDGVPFDVERERVRVEETVERMMAAGLEPGSSRALRMFQ
ncbi:MAG: hypothetical protein JST68_15905 [Bacteroidetes bacterium]|nr:hypothetical protein [Bacteroidota bacterium]